MKALGIGETDEALALNSHRYRNPETGELLPFSVTEIARSFDPTDSFGAGAQWGARLQREGKNPIDERDKAGDLGTRIHAHMPRYAFGKKVDVLPDEETRLDAFDGFTFAKHPKWMESECAVLVGDSVGGRLDLIGEFEGGMGVVDIKSGRENEWTDRLQVASYCRAKSILVFDKKGNIIGTRPMPRITFGGCLYLHEDGTYAWRRWLDNEDEIDVWYFHFEALVGMRLAMRATTAYRKATR
jgi:hypothetical protein